jgi:hypothetical protein
MFKDLDKFLMLNIIADIKENNTFKAIRNKQKFDSGELV